MKHALMAKQILQINNFATELQKKDPTLSRRDALDQAYIKFTKVNKK